MCKIDSVELLENETETTGAVASEMSDARLQAVTTRQQAGPRKQNKSGVQPGEPPPFRPARPPCYENVNDEFPKPGGAEPARPTRPPDVTVSNRSNEPAAGHAASPSSGAAQLDWSIQKLSEMQASDRDLAPIREWLKSGREKPGIQELKPYSPATKAYCAQWDVLTWENEVVYRQYIGSDGNVEFLQLLVPYEMRNGLLKEIHKNVSGHLSTDKTQQQVQQRRGYWYCWKRDVDIFCRTCVPCSQYFRGATPKHSKLQDMILKRLNDVKYLVQRANKTTVEHVNKLKASVSRYVSVVHRKMFSCHVCGYDGPSSRAMVRHYLGHHQMEWRGPGQPARPISTSRLLEARKRLRRLQ